MLLQLCYVEKAQIAFALTRQDIRYLMTVSFSKYLVL